MSRLVEAEKNSKRLFVAIELSPHVKDVLEHCQAQINGLHLARGKCPRRDNLHLTLKFLGEVENDRLPTIIERLKLIPKGRLDLHLGSLGHFPHGNRYVHVIWAAIIGKGLKELAINVEFATADLTGSPDHSFEPHITLMRVTRCPDADRLIEEIKQIHVPRAKLDVLEFALFESQTHSTGLRHQIIERFSL